jgi:hypothetical protein
MPIGNEPIVMHQNDKNTINPLHFRVSKELKTLLLGSALFAGNVVAQGGQGHVGVVSEPYYHVQTLIGRLVLDDSLVTRDADETYEGEWGEKIPYIGAAAQVPIKDGMFGFGWEGGGFVSWQSDVVDYFVKSGSDGTVAAFSLDTSYFAIETFLGGYLSVQPTPFFRAYVSAGPMLTLGFLNTVDPEEQPSPSARSVVVIDFSDTDVNLTPGAYGRAGVEIQLAQNTWIGVSGRYMKTELDFGDSIGEVSLDGTSWFISLGARM